MKQFRLVPRVAFLLVTSLLTCLISNATPQHGFNVKEYDRFHDVLHPLEHDALPQKDFRRIRSKASELVRLGKAIVKVGAPEGFPTARQELSKELKKFDRALVRFKADAKSGTDDQLKVSYSAVHDSFEMLASILPTLYPRGSPPTVSLDCPSGKPEAGSQITITARTSDSGKLLFTWTASAGKIQTGQGTPTITIDTTGLAGQTILVTAEVNDGSGLTTVADCEVQVAPQTAKVDPLAPLLSSKAPGMEKARGLTVLTNSKLWLSAVGAGCS